MAVAARTSEITGQRASLHSVLVRRPYLSGYVFLQVLHTEHRNVARKTWSTSIELHSRHLGLSEGSRERTEESISAEMRGGWSLMTHKALRFSQFAPFLCVSPIDVSPHRFLAHFHHPH